LKHKKINEKREFSELWQKQKIRESSGRGKGNHLRGLNDAGKKSGEKGGKRGPVCFSCFKAQGGRVGKRALFTKKTMEKETKPISTSKMGRQVKKSPEETRGSKNRKKA